MFRALLAHLQEALHKQHYTILYWYTTMHSQQNINFNTDCVDSDKKLPNLIYFGVFDYYMSPRLLIKQWCRLWRISNDLTWPMFEGWICIAYTSDVCKVTEWSCSAFYFDQLLFLTFCIYTFHINGIQIFITTLHNFLKIYSIGQH
jgi:hypothetical protein